MSKGQKIQTQLVDEDAVYATGNDVFTHIRNKRFPDLPDTPQDTNVGDGGILTKEQVVDLIARFSDDVDNSTKRAWRTRKVEAYEVPVKFSHEQKRSRHRRRRRRSGTGGTARVQTHAGHRAMADLPHNHIRTPDANEGDVVEVLNPRSADDVTGSDGREDGNYVVDERKGVIRPEVNLFVPSGSGTARGRDIEGGRLRVTYRYGMEPNPTDEPDLTAPYQLSTSVPGDIQDAVALLTAARLVGSDQYGELVPNQSGDEPSLAEAVSSWKSEARSTIDGFTRP
jgi:hypothetical protein